MTVSTAYAALSYSGNSSTTAFAVSWPFLTGTIVVTLISAAGVETVKTISTHYTVSGGTDSNGLPATGTVTMLTAPATGETLRIERSTPKRQPATWGETDPFPQKVIEAAFDRLTLLVQEARGEQGAAGAAAWTTPTAWASGGVYAVGPPSNVVTYLGETYVTITDHTATTSFDATKFVKVAAKGTNGANGNGSGDVVGPAGNVADGDLAVFNGTTGKTIKKATSLSSDKVDHTAATVASAATCDIGGAISDRVLVSGTTTITSFGPVASKLRFVTFAGVLTLTYNATSLILPTAASITTAAGDSAIFHSDGSGNWTCLAYTRADGTIIGTVAFAKIADAAISTAAEYRANTASKILTTDKVWSAADFVTLTDGSTVAVDLSTGFNFTLTLGGNRTIASPSNPKPGQGGVILIKQDGTGSRTAAWGTNWKWPTGTAPTLTTTASRTDKVFYVVESSTIIHASIEKDSR